jgi:hypothetical protein
MAAASDTRVWRTMSKQFSGFQKEIYCFNQSVDTNNTSFKRKTQKIIKIFGALLLKTEFKTWLFGTQSEKATKAN